MGTESGLSKRAAQGAFEVVIGFKPYDNCEPGINDKPRAAPGAEPGRAAMNIIFRMISQDTFWNSLLFVHFVLAVALLAAGQAAGGFIDRSPAPAASYTAMIIVLYVIQALMGAWIYVKYRTYVRIPMEEFKHYWTVGSFEFKEHVVAMGLGLLPAYWYFWRQPRSAEHGGIRMWLTIFL